MEIPVYLFAGFLDSGKTSFINGILEDGFAQEEKTLLLCCEEGVEEYHPSVLRNVTVVTLEEEQLNANFLKELERKHKPGQIIIEYNGMWPMEPLFRDALPDNWLLYQVVTQVEASTFEVYAKNMGQLMMEKLAGADMIVFNRCTEELRAALRKRNLKMVNRRADIFLDNVDGTSEDYFDGTEVPFDLSADLIEIPDDDYGVFYVDVTDHPERYMGKQIRAKVLLCKVDKYPGELIPGRFAMVCCSEDITFLGMACRGEGLDTGEDRHWEEVTFTIEAGHHPAYGDEPGPVMVIGEHHLCEAPKPDIVSF